MTDLDKLIAAVEAGAVDFDWGFAASPSRKALPMQWHDAMNAYLGSLDAAHRLHEALLPGWFCTLSTLCEPFDGETVSLAPSKEWRAEVSDGYRGWPDDDDPEDHFQSADSANPARAWLLAILRALKAKGGA